MLTSQLEEGPHCPASTPLGPPLHPQPQGKKGKESREVPSHSPEPRPQAQCR